MTDPGSRPLLPPGGERRVGWRWPSSSWWWPSAWSRRPLENPEKRVYQNDQNGGPSGSILTIGSELHIFYLNWMACNNLGAGPKELLQLLLCLSAKLGLKAMHPTSYFVFDYYREFCFPDCDIYHFETKSRIVRFMRNLHKMIHHSGSQQA